MLNNHRKYFRRGMTHLDATSTFKNRSKTYGSRCTSPNSARKSPRIGPQIQLIDDFKKDQRKRRKTTDVQLTIYCKFCNMTIHGDFEEHLYNSHFKQKLESVIPKQTRCCSGK